MTSLFYGTEILLKKGSVCTKPQKWVWYLWLRPSLLPDFVAFFQYFEQQSIILSDISLLRLGKNMSIAMQNMTESKKNSYLCPSIVKDLPLD